jgi:hypothetical protein
MDKKLPNNWKLIKTDGSPVQEEPVVPADNFVQTIAANVDNTGATDAEFREFIRNTLPIVIYDRNENE